MTDEQKLEFETVLGLGKFMYDAIFKLGAMSFTLNGLLLGSVSVLLPQAGKFADSLYVFGIYTIAIVGSIYNVGALFSYGSLVALSYKLVAQFENIDRSLKLGVSECRTPLSDKLGIIAMIFSIVFLSCWIAIWIYLILHIPGANPPSIPA
jgi:hypothetical protein